MVHLFVHVSVYYFRIHPEVSAAIHVRTLFTLAGRLIALYPNAFVLFVGCGDGYPSPQNADVVSAVDKFSDELATWDSANIAEFCPRLTGDNFMMLNAFTNLPANGVEDRYGHLNAEGWKIVSSALDSMLSTTFPKVIEPRARFAAPLAVTGM